MKKWQEERNYRRVRNEAGEVIANIITVDGMDVEVPEDVYLAYSQADRRERYITEEQSSGKLLSLEQMEEDDLLPDYVGAETAPSAETEALEREELRNLAEQKQILLLALLSLKDTDRELINALFFDGASTREYAQRMGVSQRAVIKRRDRILRDLKKFFENSSKYQRRMERGEFITCTAPYGYRIVNKKDLEIVPEEAATVRWIFDAYLKGRSSGWIAEQLTAKGIPSQSGAECWRETGVRYLLTNEKYIGDALSQKSYSCGFPFVQKRNHGERLQYYTENSHPAIIDRDTFERVQALLQKKAQKEKKRREKSPLALKIVCGNCGTVFQRRSSQSGYVTWVCRTHDRHAADCPVGRIPEAEIHAAFLRMYHRLKSNADIILAPALRQLNTLDTILRQNHPQLLTINRAIAEATEESHKISTLRASGLLDADICAARMNAISARLAQLRGERRRLTENKAIDETMDALRKVEQTLLNGPERLDGFDEELFERLVEKIIAESQNRIRFRLYGGLELTEQWEVAAR